MEKSKERLVLHDTSFVDLMANRIFNVLLVANPYDAFILEDDGRIDEKIFAEYAKLGLRYPPRFTQVASLEEAEAEMESGSYDLLICMPGTDNNDVFDIARLIKERYPQVPIVVLTPFSHGVNRRMQQEDLSIFEYVFCWLGNTELLLSIIKLMEDKMNVEHDTQSGVQMILLVEDNIRFYSSFLPLLYKFVLQQSLLFASEALNAQLEQLRMRGRPKIVLARSYEEAYTLWEKYHENTLGVISDRRFPKDGEVDEKAGYKLLTAIRRQDSFVPLIMESSESAASELAASCHAKFIDKNSKKLDIDLRNMLTRYFGFGDFVFRDPTSMNEVVRIRNLKELQDNIFTVPRESLLYHISHNNVSRWLCSRALFPISEFLKHITWDSLQDVDAHRQIIFDAIVSYRKMRNQGVVAVFQRERFDKYSNFARIGDGSLGGKGRGLAFLDHIIKRHEDLNELSSVQTMIPKTVVLCTDIFDEFMDTNELYQVALGDCPDEDILRYFLHARLPQRLIGDLMAFLEVVKSPIAIRSSSLLEDSHYQPFAGVYSTYMIPYVEDPYERLRLLSEAIKSVYASVYYRSSKDYMMATSNLIDQEKMAVILQEVVGKQYEQRFYPTFSGVARSINYYPIGPEQAEEGTVNLALGLGKYIVDGGVCLRVCPYHPDHVLQTSELDMALRDTQTRFYALDLGETHLKFEVNDGFNIRKLAVKEADRDGAVKYICSTYDPYDQMLRDGYYEGGRKVLTFSGVLQHGVIPLPQLLRLILRYGQEEMRRPVEIEFAANIHDDRTCDFYLLQIRPMVDNRMMLDEDLTQVPDEDCLIRSHSAIGHGIIRDLTDVIYVRTEGYRPSLNPQLAEEIERMNRKMIDEGRSYILIGPGRWGSSDPWLGIPVKWPHISGARIIVEAGLDSFQVDPSQGTHFFQNLTSLGVSYLTIDEFRGDGHWCEAMLEAMPAEQETELVRHVHFDRPFTVKVDGIHTEAVVLQE